jgi:hypothetical protein
MTLEDFFVLLISVSAALFVFSLIVLALQESRDQLRRAWMWLRERLRRR